MSAMPPDPPFATPTADDIGFSQLIAVIRDSESFLFNLVNRIQDASTVPPQMRDALGDAQPEVVTRARALVVEIRNGGYDSELHAHALGDEDPAWGLKYRGYVNARTSFDEKVASPTVRGDEGTHRYLRWAKRPLQWLNVILGSLADVIPGAGGAYKELKESTEAVVDDALDVDREA